MGADVSRSVAAANRAVLGRRHERHRLGSRLRSLRSASCRAFARAANSPTSSGRCRANSARRTRTNTAATTACRRNTSADSSARIYAGTKGAAATASSASIAAIRGTASTIRRSPSPGLDVREGDAIVAIGGKRLSRDVIAGPSCSSTPPDADVSITLRSRKDEERTVLVKALASEAALRYRAWVEENRAHRARAHRRPRRLPAHSRHGAVGILRVPPRLPQRVRSQRVDRRRSLQSRRPRLAAAAREARAQARRLRRAALRCARFRIRRNRSAARSSR